MTVAQGYQSLTENIQVQIKSSTVTMSLLSCVYFLTFSRKPRTPVLSVPIKWYTSRVLEPHLLSSQNTLWDYNAVKNFNYTFCQFDTINNRYDHLTHVLLEQYCSFNSFILGSMITKYHINAGLYNQHTQYIPSNIPWLRTIV